MIQKLKTYLLLAVTLLAIAAALYAWFRPHGSSAPATQQYAPAPEIKKTDNIQRVEVVVKHVMALDKKEVSKKLDLPANIAEDDKEQVTETAVVGPYKGKTDVVSVINTETGKSEIITKQEALPLFGFPNGKEIGTRYGYSASTKGTIGLQAELFGRWTLLRVGNVYGAIYGEISTRPESKAMVEMSYRF